MWKKETLLVVAVAVVLCSVALADGMLIPGPPTHIIPEEPYFTVKYHHVKTEIKDQVATTYVDQVFINEGSREMEATYIFPLPPGAVVQDFTLRADGQEINATLLDKDEAQKTYEDIVRRRKDPAILTWAGENMYRAKIFPIPPDGERRIEIRYSELLSYDTGTVGYRYPLSPESLSHEPIESVVFSCDIHAQQPIGTVYSPSHDISVNRMTKNHVRASYEEKDVLPENDVILYYNVADDPVGLSLMTFKEPGKDGFFLLLAAPTVERTETKAVPKNISFVLDTSGSMSGEKIEQAKAALTFCVNRLNPEDRFNIVAFSDGVREFSEELLAADEGAVKRARKFISDFEASGGTDIDSALKTALKYRVKEKTNYVVFLTDGQPTVGETDEQKITDNVSGYADEISCSTRMFVFGVGYDVNTNFLDRLAQDNGGLTTYVRPTESIETKVSNFYAKIAQPLLTDIAIGYGDVNAYDTFPRELPDLFHGSQIEVFGRYRTETTCTTAVKLSGATPEGSQTFTVEAEFPEERGETDYIAALWAARKIGYLLDQIRLHGESDELVDEVIRLSMEYGILTEYTAFLATEKEALSVEEAQDRATDSMKASFAAPVGAGATSRAQNAQVMQQQAQVGYTNTYLDAQGNRQRIANIRNIGQRGFVQREGRWEDTRFQKDQEVDLKVQAFSEAYFQLSRQFPTLNTQMAVGENVLVILNGQVIEIGDEGKERLTPEELEALQAEKPHDGAQEPDVGVRPIDDSPEPGGILAFLRRLLAGLTAA
ncbi:MAG: VIT domain-containing protein [Armatimonadota bacterium]